jgi:hypothetical protein
VPTGRERAEAHALTFILPVEGDGYGSTAQETCHVDPVVLTSILVVVVAL